MANKKDIIEILEENTLLETKNEFLSKQNNDLRNQISELEEIVSKLKTEKEEQEAVSEATKDEFRRIIQYLNNKYELNFILEDRLEVVELDIN